MKKRILERTPEQKEMVSEYEKWKIYGTYTDYLEDLDGVDSFCLTRHGAEEVIKRANKAINLMKDCIKEIKEKERIAINKLLEEIKMKNIKVYQKIELVDVKESIRNKGNTHQWGISQDKKLTKGQIATIEYINGNPSTFKNFSKQDIIECVNEEAIVELAGGVLVMKKKEPNTIYSRMISTRIKGKYQGSKTNE